MVQTTDVFIIGGGPAGLAAAIAVRRKGLRVTVADGAQPPIDKACGEGLMPDTLAALRELGVTVDPSEGFGFRGVRFLQGGSAVDADFPERQGIGVRRPVLHQRMVERAREVGVSFLWKTPVTRICPEGVLAGGKVIAAKWIVGADGIRSRVRRWIGLDGPRPQECRYAFRRHYRVAPWSEHMEIYWGRRTQAYVTPVGKQEVCAVLISRKPGVHFASLEADFPELAERLSAAQPVSSERGAVTLSLRLKHVYRGRIALIGDASGSVDAVTGQGLSLSFHQAMALADALEAGHLSRYQSTHRRLARRPALMGRLMLLLDSHSALRDRAVRALASDPRVFARLLAVHVGARSPAYLAASGARLGWRLVTA